MAETLKRSVEQAKKMNYDWEQMATPLISEEQLHSKAMQVVQLESEKGDPERATALYDLYLECSAEPHHDDPSKSMYTPNGLIEQLQFASSINPVNKLRKRYYETANWHDCHSKESLLIGILRSKTGQIFSECLLELAISVADVCFLDAFPREWISNLTATKTKASSDISKFFGCFKIHSLNGLVSRFAYWNRKNTKPGAEFIENKAVVNNNHPCWGVRFASKRALIFSQIKSVIKLHDEALLTDGTLSNSKLRYGCETLTTEAKLRVDEDETIADLPNYKTLLTRSEISLQWRAAKRTERKLESKLGELVGFKNNVSYKCNACSTVLKRNSIPIVKRSSTGYDTLMSSNWFCEGPCKSQRTGWTCLDSQYPGAVIYLDRVRGKDQNGRTQEQNDDRSKKRRKATQEHKANKASALEDL